MKTAAMLALICLSLLLADGKRPDLTGSWKMNADKSEFEGSKAPDSLVWQIKDTTESIEIKESWTTGGDTSTGWWTFIKWNKESKNRMGSAEAVSKISEQPDDSILEETTMKTESGAVITRTAVTHVASDGKTLTQESQMDGPGGTMKRRIVMEKQ